MRFLSELTVRKKLLLGASAVIVLSGVVSLVTLSGLIDLNNKMTTITTNHVPGMVRSARLHRNIEELRVLQRDVLLAENANQVSALQQKIQSKSKELLDRLDKLDELDLSPQARSKAILFRQSYTDFSNLLNSMVSKVLASSDSNILHDPTIADIQKNTFSAGEMATEMAVEFTNLLEESLEQIHEQADQMTSQLMIISIVLMMVATLVIILISVLLGQGIASGITRLMTVADAITRGDLDSEVTGQGNDDLGSLAKSIGKMQSALRENRVTTSQQDWLKTGVSRLNDALRGEQDPAKLSSKVVAEVCTYLDAKVGAMYVREQNGKGDRLALKGSYAFTHRKAISNEYAPGEGLVGQAALERKQILIREIPDDYIQVVSGLGNAAPKAIAVTPLLFEDDVRGVLEIASLRPLSPLELEYMNQITLAIAAAFEILHNQNKLLIQSEEMQVSNEELREKTEALSRSMKELHTQSQQLERSNAELEEHTARLKQSEDSLRLQQEELAVTNTELKDRNVSLERQKRDIESARLELSTKAEELSLASRYKSEFLANMSHELRTPLNSLLILARDLHKNDNGNLDNNQVQAAGVIYDSGSDLLNLINEILDLSKIESGKMDLNIDDVSLMDISDTLKSNFSPMADSQGLKFNVEFRPNTPPTIRTDAKRLMQVIRNLVGNALKFTEKGSVSVVFGLGERKVAGANSLTISVVDTGIGIPKDKQKLVFEAFQQADSGDRRKYGGTGLGLSISRELAALLGGTITLDSEPGKGSTFTLELSATWTPPVETRRVGLTHESMAAIQPPAGTAKSIGHDEKTTASQPKVEDDRDKITAGDRVLLVVEDDVRFAQILANDARTKGFKVLVAHTGEDGLVLAQSHIPLGIVLDLHLPQMDGWATLSALKDEVATRHIPVHILSVEEPSLELRRIGAIGHASKPIDRDGIAKVLERIEGASASATKHVLVVEDDPIMRRDTVSLIGNGNVIVEEVGSGAEALDALKKQHFDLMLLDLGLPDMQGQKLLATMTEEKIPAPPIIIHTVRQLTREEEDGLRHYTDSVILKDVRSRERLLDEIALFLHRIVTDLPEDKRRVIEDIRRSDEPLKGKRVLIAEDDMRTMFAMARLLASHGIEPIKAENGEKALELLAQQSNVDLVLMDMMMPVMDGYEATRRIRQLPGMEHLPILALTAKAMKEDRQKCLDAGATEYLSKPIDNERLISTMRVWLKR